MFSDHEVMATIPVRDLKTAKTFYETTLALKPTERQQQGTLSFQCGRSILLVYQSQFAGTNKATSATWRVGDEIDAIVKTLKSKGVTFEHYDLPGLTLKGDVHVGGTHKVAWFQDPDGNIISIVNG